MAHKDPETRATYGTEYKRKNFTRYLHDSCKSRATRLGLDFNIEVSDIVVPDVCPILGIKLESGLGSGKRGPRKNSPTVDRIEAGLGYVKGNIRVVSALANGMKSSATPEELMLFAQWVLREHGK